LNGFATCLRLEQVYWGILAEMARVNGCSVNSLLAHLDREVHLRHGGVRNFSGLVRVVRVVHSLKEGGCIVTAWFWAAKAAECRPVQSYGCTGRI
jgi:predicted DNA-binding ribbon-helix-helix protein